MAKRAPRLSLAEMVAELGFNLTAADLTGQASAKRYYSDLSLVRNDEYERMLREYDDMTSMRKIGSQDCVSMVNQKIIIAQGTSAVVIEQIATVGTYVFAVDIQYDKQFHFPLLLSRSQIKRVLSVPLLHDKSAATDASPLLSLPREIRDRIFLECFVDTEKHISDIGDLENDIFLRQLLDLNGYYFPLGHAYPILQACHTTRMEGLPLMYEQTCFLFDDLDDLVRFLISVGKIGRNSVRKLDFPWESRSDLESDWNNGSEIKESCTVLPKHHALRAVRLLSSCTRLMSLRVRFDERTVEGCSTDSFSSDEGILGLCSLKNVDRFEISSLDSRPLGHLEKVRWLTAQMSQKDSDHGTDTIIHGLLSKRSSLIADSQSK